MNIPSFKEDHISQQPAIELLKKLGYIYLNPEQALELRGGKTSNVLLEDVLRKKLHEINSIKYSSTAEIRLFTDANIENGIVALKEMPFQDGYIAACQTAYERLTLEKHLNKALTEIEKVLILNILIGKILPTMFFMLPKNSA